MTLTLSPNELHHLLAFLGLLLQSFRDLVLLRAPRKKTPQRVGR